MCVCEGVGGGGGENILLWSLCVKVGSNSCIVLVAVNPVQIRWYFCPCI